MSDEGELLMVPSDKNTRGAIANGWISCKTEMVLGRRSDSWYLLLAKDYSSRNEWLDRMADTLRDLYCSEIRFADILLTLCGQLS